MNWKSLASEITATWTSGYTADLLLNEDGEECGVVVFCDGEDVGRIEEKLGRFTVTSEDEDVEESLEHFLNR